MRPQSDGVDSANSFVCEIPLTWWFRIKGFTVLDRSRTGATVVTLCAGLVCLPCHRPAVESADLDRRSGWLHCTRAVRVFRQSRNKEVAIGNKTLNPSPLRFGRFNYNTGNRQSE
jgi:hypothetical protein